MKKAARWIAFLALASWLHVLFHVHPKDAGQLHAAHEFCQICALSQGASQKSLLPALQAALPLPESAYERPAAPRDPDFSRPTRSSKLSRAPPRAIPA